MFAGFDSMVSINWDKSTETKLFIPMFKFMGRKLEFAGCVMVIVDGLSYVEILK